MNRYGILAAAVLLQMCLGATYSWSVYVQGLKELTGLLQGPVQVPFSVFYFVFPATAVLAGTLLPRLGPRRCAAAGGVLFGCGWMVASLGAHHFSLTVLGIGVVAGVGAGLAYLVPIATCVQWFPRHRGVVTGLAVAGFGGGAALVSQVAGLLMASRGATPFQIFGVLGLVFLLVAGAAGAALRSPPGATARPQGPLPVGQVLSRPAFRVLYLAMFAGLAAGFAVNANLKELFPESPRAGVAAISLFALGNAGGRVGWGLAFDRLRSATAIRTNLLCQAGFLAAAPWLTGSAAGFLAFAAAAGFNYGGVLVLYAASAARLWGPERLGQVYGWLFSANIPAALAPIGAGLAYDLGGSFSPALWALAILLAVAAFRVRGGTGPLDPATRGSSPTAPEQGPSRSTG
ncbi:MAG: MFS transporter [Deferrisomatales bacterium]|nr:MFS transporter [Deferrisomatales bacterium]